MQICDTLLYRGIEHTLVYGGGPLLEAWPENERPELEPMGTACWRGFIATWSIDGEGWLRVTSVKTGQMFELAPDGGIRFTRDQSLYRLFAGHDAPVTATWFTGELVTGYGKEEHEIGTYDTTYEHYRIFHVEAGRVVRVEEHDSGWWEKRHSS